MTLRIIVAALAMGVGTFAAVAVAQNIGKPQVLAGKLDSLNLTLLGVGLIALPLGIVLPRLVFAASRRAPPLNPPPGFSPEQSRIFSIQQRIQTSAIIGCALFEGGAFANIFGYMQTRELLHLVMAGALVLGILANFPTAASYEQRIEDERRRLEEEAAFPRAP